MWKIITPDRKGFATADDPRNASKLTEQMKEDGIEMDVVNYGVAIGACAKSADLKGAMKLLKVKPCPPLIAHFVN